MQNNTEVYLMAKEPLKSYNHRDILQSYKSVENLKKFGRKCPCEYSAEEAMYLLQNESAVYARLQSWYWALIMHNTVTLQLGWGKMDYTAESLQV